jgi:hypothetical protein
MPQNLLALTPLGDATQIESFHTICVALPKAGKSYWRGRLSTVDLLVITSLDEHLYIENMIYFLNKTTNLNEEVNCTESSPLISIPYPRWQLSGVNYVLKFADFLLQNFARVNGSLE